MQPQADQRPESRATSFEAAPADATEHYSGPKLLVGAYAALWLVIFAWVVVMWRKQRALDTRIAELDQVIEGAARRKPPAGG
jgi:CcmD family protein